MKPLVIYHANCTDGFGAAFAAWLKLGDEAEYLPMEHGQALPEQLHSPVGLELYILDFSFRRDQMDTFFQYSKRIVWLDHHKTAFEMMDRTPGELYRVHDAEQCIILDNNKSGALLAWEYFHPGTEVPMLIQHIDDRDRWQFKLIGTKELHAAFASYKPWTFDKWKVWLNDWDLMHRDDMVLEGLAVLRAHNQNVQECLKQARGCRIAKPGRQRGNRVEPPWQHCIAGPNHLGYFDEAYVSGLAANAPAFLASDLGHELANKSGTFGLVWSMAGDGQIHCSLRSNGEYDVSAIAKAFGGGGHRNAAGFSTDIDTLVSWLK